MTNEPIPSLIGLVRAANLKIGFLAEQLQMSRGTFYQRTKKPGHFTVDEIVAIAALLQKTPNAILEVMLVDRQKASSDDMLLD